MKLDTALSDVRQAIESKRPRNLSVRDFLRHLVETYVPQEPAELSEDQAEAILLARGLLARQRLTQAEGGSISAPDHEWGALIFFFPGATRLAANGLWTAFF